MTNVKSILAKLAAADNNVNVLTEKERRVLTDLIDNFCEQAGIVLVDEVSGGMDIHVN